MAATLPAMCTDAAAAVYIEICAGHATAMAPLRDADPDPVQAFHEVALVGQGALSPEVLYTPASANV